MTRFVTPLLRGIIVILGLAVLALGAGLPLVARDIADAAPEFKVVRAPYVVAGEAALGCVLVGLVALWFLLGRVRRDRIFSPASLRRVDAIIGAAAVAAGLTGPIYAHQMLAPVPGIGPAAWPLLLLVLAGIGFVLTMLAMRRLLVTAVGVRTDIDGVI